MTLRAGAGFHSRESTRIPAGSSKYTLNSETFSPTSKTYTASRPTSVSLWSGAQSSLCRQVPCRRNPSRRPGDGSSTGTKILGPDRSIEPNRARSSAKRQLKCVAILSQAAVDTVAFATSGTCGERVSRPISGGAQRRGECSRSGICGAAAKESRRRD